MHCCVMLRGAAVCCAVLTWTRYQGRVKNSKAKVRTWGLPADISFLPYSRNLSCRGQLLAGFRIDQSAPVGQSTHCVAHRTAQHSTAQHPQDSRCCKTRRITTTSVCTTAVEVRNTAHEQYSSAMSAHLAAAECLGSGVRPASSWKESNRGTAR